MPKSLFILIDSDHLRTADVDNLGALSEVSRAAGIAPSLAIVKTGDNHSLEQVPGSFDEIREFSIPDDAGDGALFIDELTSQLASEYDASLVVSINDISSQNWAPRVAAKLNADFIPGCSKLLFDQGKLSSTRPIMGGMVNKTTRIDAQCTVLLYDGEDLEYSGSYNPLPNEYENENITSRNATLIKRERLPDTGGIPLKGAEKVVSGGLGVGSKENWSKVENFAARIEAALGASRAAVDMGWVPSSRQVGFSGLKVSPDVYVAIGISGAVHHLAGISGARKIVAVNKDAEAPIFQVADIAIIGDYDEILEEANKQLDQA